MNRLERKLSPIEELVADFEQGQQGKKGRKAQFTRKMREMSKEQQEDVWKALEARGHQRQELPPQRISSYQPKEDHRTYICWTEEEWRILGESIWELRKENPTLSIMELTRRTQEKLLTPDRQRSKNSLTGPEKIVPILTFLQEKDSKLLQQANERNTFAMLAEAKNKLLIESENRANKLTEELNRLQKQFQQVDQLDSLFTKDEAIGTLTDDEIVSLFKEKVLGYLTSEEKLEGIPNETILTKIPFTELVAQTVKQGLEIFLDSRNKPKQEKLLPVPKNENGGNRETATPKFKPIPVTNPPRVTIATLLPNQQQEVETRLGGRAKFHFVYNHQPNDSAIPPNQDYIVLMTSFISHNIQDLAKRKVEGTSTQLILIHGGITSLVRKLDSILPME